MPGAAQNNPATNPAANAAARANLFANGFFSSIELPSQSFVDGGSYAFDMPHAGVGLYAMLRVTGSLEWSNTNTATSAPSLSSLSPFNIFNSIIFKDYLGNTRLSVDGPSLHFREVLQYYKDTSGEAPNTQADRSYSRADVDTFTVPAINTPVGVDFAVLVPFSFHENTTVGTLPFTVPAGNNTLYVTLNPLLNITATQNAESPLQATGSTGTTATLTGVVQVTYYYIDPLPGSTLPLMDFNQVYELVTTKSTDNLSSSAVKQIILPTGRTYQGLYAQIVVAGELYDGSGAGISKLQFLINESTPTLAENYASYLHRIRRTYGRDLPAGIIYWDLRNRPISPSNYGSIAIQALLSSSFNASGETFFNLLKEALYFLQTNVY